MANKGPKILRIEPVDSVEGLRILEGLAREIWLEHYPPIIGLPQVHYMLERFQSLDAMAAQLAAGMRYGLVRTEIGPAGYFACERKADGLFLSKLYVKASERGRGIARQCLRFLIASEKPERITLTVNRQNPLALAAYLRLGFTRAGEVKTDIGHGFSMDDFVLEWRAPTP